MLLLPVIGVMAMTSEWTQRTALTTFTLSPRRVRVQLAKFVSAIVLSVVVLTATALLALAATLDRWGHRRRRSVVRRTRRRARRRLPDRPR